jgi:hypothetical protein
MRAFSLIGLDRGKQADRQQPDQQYSQNVIVRSHYQPSAADSAFKPGDRDRSPGTQAFSLTRT